MTHGSSPATHVGTCQTCGLEGVGLHSILDRRTGAPHWTCVDQFACFDTFRRLPYAPASPAPTRSETPTERVCRSEPLPISGGPAGAAS